MRSWRSNILLRNPLFAPVLLTAVILVVYYPSLLSGIHPIDDPGIFALYAASPSLSDILLPGNGYYFRPVVGFSYYLDNLLWGMDPGFMHLENILLHCSNSILVYFLACRVPIDDDIPIIPLFVALFFALHPVNVEAVTWIAGRTDPLLALFVLSACFFVLRWLDKPRWQNISTAMVLFVFALLTKETALASVAVALLFVLTWPGTATTLQRLKVAGTIIISGVLLVICALYFKGDSSGLSRFIAGLDLHVAQVARQLLIAFGFYFKKLIFPFPLNFAVNTVTPLYGLLGVILFPTAWLVLRRDRLAGCFFISAAFFILPALLVTVMQIAWTPLAERYLYLPSAFFALGLVGAFKAGYQKYSVVLISSVIFLLCGSAFGSFQRNLLWKDSLSFFQDAVAKSPEFGSVYYSLGGILLQKGEIDRADEAFVTADRLNKRVSMRIPIKLSMMVSKIAKGENLEARMFFFQQFKNKRNAPVDFLELLCKADSNRFESLETEDKILLAQDLLETLGILYQKNSDPFWLYRSGQIALISGDSAGAAVLFRKAYNAAPMDSHYKAAAKTNYLRLEATK